MNVNHKSDFRKLCIKKLEFSSRFSKYYKDKIIIRKLENFIKLKEVKNILLYVPLGTEVDVKPLINKLRKYKNKNVYLPNGPSKGGAMLAMTLAQVNESQSSLASAIQNTQNIPKQNKLKALINSQVYSKS